METTEIIISKANAIRFKENNSLMPSFDNRLSYEEDFGNVPVRYYNQTIFVKSWKLVQIKAGLTAVVSLFKVDIDGVETEILTPVVTTYPTFKIYDFLLTFSTTEPCFYLEAKESGTVKHTSEWQQVIDEDDSYLKIEWTNLDLLSNSFEFDYLTVTAKANVNYMMVKGRLLEYEPSGEETVYDNQEKTEIIKANYYRGLSLELEVIPRQIAEIIGIATRHDEFQVNEVSFVASEIPEMEMFGAAIQFKALLKQPLILGINTHDIGFDCDSTTTDMIENKAQYDASGSGSFSVSDGYGVTQIITKVVSGTPTLIVGETVGGDNILPSELLTRSIPPQTDNLRYAKDIEGAWTIYYDVTGGVIDIFIQTMQFNPTV